MTRQPATHNEALFDMQQREQSKRSGPYAHTCAASGCREYGTLSIDSGKTWRCPQHNGLTERLGRAAA